MSSNKRRNIIIIISIIIIGIITFIGFKIYNKNHDNRIIKIINESFSIIINNDSSNDKLQKALDNLNNINIDCLKEQNGEFINYCSEKNKYISYAKTKILYNKLNDNSSYDDYDKLYKEIDKNIYYDSNSEQDELFISFSREVKNKYMNFLIDKVLQGDSNRVTDITSSLSGVQYTKYNTKDDNLTKEETCVSIEDNDFGNIYYFAMVMDIF